MNIIDLSKFSDKELLELQKKIKEEREGRYGERLFKSHIHSVIVNALFDKFQKRDKVSSNYIGNADPYDRVKASIFTICDYTLGNFTARVTSNKYYWSANGNYVKVDNEAYKNMANDLIEVVNKYFPKEAE